MSQSPQNLKRYLLEHTLTRRRLWVAASDFEAACRCVGWFPAETCLLQQEPPPTKRERLPQAQHKP